MRFIIKLFKGALIGISVVIPGVSGGSMAMSMGIYDSIIDFVTARKGTIRQGRFLLPYAMGVLAGVAVFSYFIEMMFAAFPLQTACAFVGMILGALPMLLRQVQGRRFGGTHALLLLGTAALMVLLPIASRHAGEVGALQSTALYALLSFGLGFIAAATMVVPGVSGSMLLILLGYYEPMLQYVNGFTAALLRLDGTVMLDRAVILAPFALGVVLGIICMARVIRALLRRFPYSTYYAIMGLVLASPFAVLYHQNLAGISAGGWILGVVVAAAGFLLATLLGRGAVE